MLDSDLGASVLPDAPPIKPCVLCGRRFYTSMRRPVCLDCRCSAARCRRTRDDGETSNVGHLLAVLGLLFRR